MNVTLPNCETCTNVLRIDRITLNETRFLTVHFRCDGDEFTVAETFDGDTADLDIILAAPAPVAWIRRKAQAGIAPVHAIRRIEAVRPIQAFGT